MAEAQIRQTAYKIWIADLVNGEFISPEGEWEPSYIQIKDKKVSRVNIIANSISKFTNDDSSYISLTLDDGSDNITLKVWNEDTKILENVNIGDMILTIARVRQYNNQIYLVPEIVRKLEKPEWMVLRKKELISEYGERKQTEKIEAPVEEEISIKPKIEEEIVQDIPSHSERQKILDSIEKQDSGEGVEVTQISTGLGEQKTNDLIKELLKEGEIFEIKPGRVKLIE